MREQFLHRGLRKFRHIKSSVYRWYTQLDRRRYVYDTYKTMKATRMCHGCVHMFITHRPTLTLKLYNFDLYRICCTSTHVVSALLRDNWEDFNWHDASRGPSKIAELLVKFIRCISQQIRTFNFPKVVREHVSDVVEYCRVSWEFNSLFSGKVILKIS